MRYFIYCRKSSEGEERQVLSLASQQEAIAKAFGDNTDIEIVGTYEEARSAKTPGRPLFAEMLQRIEAGEAEGIASWAPDRLARNSIDGGYIIYLLDTGALRDLKFATYTFENNSQGKFMLGIMFNQSKYYSDALSENVKRGNATKVAMGWRPNRAPLGYANCPVTRTTIPDPEQFPIIRRIFDLFLTGAYTPRQLVKLVGQEWGYLTPRTTRTGGRPLGRSSIYHILSNPFYKGVIVWDGKSYPGRHKPMLTDKEFDQAQALLAGRTTERPQRLCFPFTNVLTCGKCGRAITAEHKTNRYGRRYTYYHCAARGRLASPCNEPSIEQAALERQLTAFLAAIRISREIAAWVRRRLQGQVAKAQALDSKHAASRATVITEIGTQLRELTSLRLRRLLTDDEFSAERQRLEETRAALENAAMPSCNESVIELLDLAERISVHALDWFQQATSDKKQKLLKILCSNPTLEGKKLCIQATEPFVIQTKKAGCISLLTVIDEVRTFTGAEKQLLTRLSDLASRGEVETTTQKLRELTHLFSGRDRSPALRRGIKGGTPSRALRPARSSRRSPVRTLQ